MTLALLFAASTYSESWISAICPRCLQHAYIHQKSLLYVIPIYRNTTLSQSHGGLMSSATFSPRIPQVNPGTYEEILGGPCDHVFKHGGFGVTQGFIIGGLHADGREEHWSRVTPRLRAIGALYGAYGRTGDRETIAAIYELIDSAFPVDDESDAYREATAPFVLWESDEETLPPKVVDLAAQDSRAGRWARRILDLDWLTTQLHSAATREDLVVARTDFAFKRN
ncbi:MAG: hypothetical protein HY812_08290 [Planctomycetes bacterium]|nr:hypothetical protein [Planctomycetota bacterium]